MPYLILALGLVALVMRCATSFCWVDESFYLSLADQLYRGGAPFVDEWHPAQVYAPLLLPLYALYVSATGGTDGIVYFFRLAYVLLSFVVALFAYRILSRNFNRYAVLAICISYLFYVRANIQGMSYYSLCTTFFFCGLLAAWCTYQRARVDDGSASWSRIVVPLLSGAFFALAIVCNPYVIVAVFIACLVALIVAIKRKNMSIFTPFAWGIAGAAIVAILYLMFILGRSEPGDIAANIGNVLSSHDENLTLMQRIPNYLSFLPVSRIGFVLTCVLCVFLVVWRALGKELNSRLRLACTIVAFVGLCLGVWAAIGSIHANKVFIVFAEFALPLYLISDDLHLSAHPEVCLFWIPGLLLSLVWQFSSNTQICGITIGYSIVFMGAVLTAFGFFRPLLAQDNAAIGRTCAALCGVAIVVVLGVTINVRITAVYSDAPSDELTATIETGPAAGLTTTPEHKTQYEAVEDLVAHVDTDGGIWIEPMAPWAYLEAKGSCAAVSTWNTFMDEADAQTYYTTHSQPEWIVVTNDDTGEAVNYVMGKVHKFPALEMYEDYNAQLRSDLDASSDYAPVYSNDWGVVYKRASKASYIGTAK